MKRLFLLIPFVALLLAGCGEKVDDDALQNISNGLIERWKYSDALEEKKEEKDLNNFKEAINKELNVLEDYDIEKYNDTKLHFLYSDYLRELENGLHIIEITKSTSDLHRDWYKHSEKRGKILKELNEKYKISIPEEYNDKLKELTTFTASSIGEGFDSEISENANMHYMEQITFRLLNSSKLSNGSFEQKSELQACLGRVDSITEELKEKYPENDKLAISLIELGQKVKNACQEKLEGNHKDDYKNSYEVGQIIGDISRIYMNNKLPPTVIKVTGKVNAND